MTLGAVVLGVQVWDWPSSAGWSFERAVPSLLLQSRLRGVRVRNCVSPWVRRRRSQSDTDRDVNCWSFSRVSTLPPLSANCCVGTIKPKSAGDQRGTTTVLHVSSELGGHHGWLSAIVDRGSTAASRWVAGWLHVDGTLAQRHRRVG